MRSKITVLLLLLVTMFPHNSYAQTTDNRIKSIINISPIILDKQLKKGEQTYTFKLTNLLNEPLGISVDVEDFAPYADETNSTGKPVTSPIVEWSKLDTQNLVINPKEKKDVTLSVNVPKDAKEGGYYEAIFFTPIYLKTDPSVPKNVVSRIGSLFFGTLGPINYQDLVHKVAVNHFDLGPLLESSQGETKFSVENNYFNHFSAKPFITITPFFGKSDRIELTEKRVLPNKARNWSEKFKVKSPYHVFYKANLAVSVGQGHYVYKNTYFVIFPWKKAFSILLIIFAIAFIYFRRAQLKRAARVLFSGK